MDRKCKKLLFVADIQFIHNFWRILRPDAHPNAHLKKIVQQIKQQIKEYADLLGFFILKRVNLKIRHNWDGGGCVCGERLNPCNSSMCDRPLVMLFPSITFLLFHHPLSDDSIKKICSSKYGILVTPIYVICPKQITKGAKFIARQKDFSASKNPVAPSFFSTEKSLPHHFFR